MLPMGSRKTKPLPKDASRAKPREKARPAERALAEDPHLARTASVPRVPAAPPTRRGIDELAQTIEAPIAGPRILILDAAESVIGDLGFAAASGTEIARYAGVSLDVFQAHFASKAALLATLCERFCDHAAHAVDDDLHDVKSPARIVDVAVRSILDAARARPALVRAILAFGDDRTLEAVRRMGARVAKQVNRTFDRLEVPPEDRPDERDLAFVVGLSFSLAHGAALFGPSSADLGLEGDALHERASRAAAGYLARSTRR